MKRKGDFIGFTFGGVHSSTLGLIRVSDGSRYQDNLLPSFQDKVIEIPGRDDTSYFSSNYSKREINVRVAYDSMTERQIRDLRVLFGDKKVKDLIFDEAPYKVFRAKPGQTLTLSYVCFDGEDGERVYKGEGTLIFTCYDPFARSRYKFLDLYSNTSPGSIAVPEWVEEDIMEQDVSKGLNFFKNLDQWKATSGMAASRASGPYDYAGDGRQNILLVNPGDRETDFILTLRGTPDSGGYLFNLKIGLTTDAGSRIIFNNTSSRNSDPSDPNYEEGMDQNEPIEDEYVQINTRNNLIEGIEIAGEVVRKTGRVYNQYMTTGVFFKIPIITVGQNGSLVITDSVGGVNNIKGYVDSIEYSYLYY